MKTISIIRCCLLLAVFTAACQKQEGATVDIDIEIQQPVVTDIAGGAKKLDFTVVVTQLGNAFDKAFDFKITPFQDNTVLGTYQTTLPTAREFVKFSVTVPGPGDYWAEANIGEAGSRSGAGTLVKVP